MKKRILYVLVFILTSCAINNKIAGKYLKQGADFKYELILRNNKTFTITERGFEVNAKCEGKWHYLSKDTVLLTCGTEDLLAQITSGYMAARQQKLTILNNNQVEYQNVILKRIPK